MKFTKMQGLGNDYLLIDGTDCPPEDLPGLARLLSRRRFGIGSDGLICYGPSRRADFSMRMFNADGSEGEMCGNGIRCLGKLVYERGLTVKTVLDIETASGVRRLWLHLSAGCVTAVTADMGQPCLGQPQRLPFRNLCLTVQPVQVGNPHRVVFLEEDEQLSPEEAGPVLGAAEDSPECNVELIRILSPDRIRMRVWERGSGETLSCGTGSCAAVAAAAAAHLVRYRCQVEQPGGVAEVEWSRDNGHLFLTGPAETVFEGSWPMENGRASHAT